MTEPQTHIGDFHVTVELPKLSAAPVSPPFWVISDTHFFHDNIIRYAGRPHNHDDLMVEAWKAVVGKDEPILHLGDVAFSSKDKLEALMPELPGKKYLILGNHDRRGRKFYHDLGFTLVDPFAMHYKGYDVAFSHEPIYGYTQYPKKINVHGHIHEKTMDDLHYINASVEHMLYEPIQVTDLLDARIEDLRWRRRPIKTNRS